MLSIDEWCPKCMGTGRIRIRYGGTYDEDADTAECWYCDGTGSIANYVANKLNPRQGPWYLHEH